MPPRSPLAPAAFPALPPVAGVALAAGAAGVRYAGRDDVMLALLAPGTAAAGVFTRSKTASAPVEWCREALVRGGGAARAVIVNAGNANAFTGRAGAAATRRTAEAVAGLAEPGTGEVFVASTGVIGEPLDDARIRAVLAELRDRASPGGWEAAVRAIMTTDTFPKGATRTAVIDGATVTLAGIAKGSGMIAPDAASPIRAPIWFNRREGHVLLNLNAADSERIYADDAHIEIVETKLPKSDKDPLEWVLENLSGADGGSDGKDILVVRLTPLGALLRLRETPGEQAVPEDARTRKVEMPPPAPKAPAPKDKAKAKKKKSKERQEPVLPRTPPRTPPVARADAGVKPLLSGLSTGRTTGKTPLSSRYMLRLSGIGLLRIDGPRQIDGLLNWIIWFDENGYPLQFEQAGRVDTKGCLALSASAKENTLLYRLAGEDGFKPVSHWPCVLPTANHRHLRLTRSPLPDRSHGILFLNEETSFPLSSTPLVLGRSNLNPSARQPDLPLELLNHPETLRWASHGGFPGAKLNAINLSRRHIGVRLKGGNLDISMAEGTAPVFILDGEGGLQQALEAGSRHHVEIEPGEMILLGSYLLRFHLENPKTISSARHSMLRSRRPA